MQGAMVRHQQPATGRKPVPRGASRMVAKEPLSARLPKANFSGLKRLLWPVLLVAAGRIARRAPNMFSYLLAIGLAGLFAGWAYSAPPLALGDRVRFVPIDEARYRRELAV